MILTNGSYNALLVKIIFPQQFVIQTIGENCIHFHQQFITRTISENQRRCEIDDDEDCHHRPLSPPVQNRR